MQKSLFKNTIYKSILSFVNIVIPLLIGPYVVKLLDVELYGIYNAVYSEFQVFLTVASFGLYTYGVREISKIRLNKEKVSTLFTNLFVIGLLSNLVIMAIYLLYAFISSKGIALLLYCLLSIQFIGNAFYIEFLNEALENYKFITIKTTIIKILYLISIFLFLKKPNDISIYAVIVSLVVFANNIVSFIYAKKHIRFDLKNIKIKKYLPSLVTILIITNIDLLYSQLDRIVLGKFANGVAVTIYYIPYFIMGTLAAIPYSIINVSIPRLSYIVANEPKDNYIKTLNKVISSLLFIIVPMCFGVFVLAHEVIFIYAGEKYLACVPVLMLACFVRILFSIESCLTNLVMYPNNQEKKLMFMTLAGGILNLILNLLLVVFKILSPLASMVTTIIVEVFVILVEYLYVSRKLNIHPSFISKKSISYFGLSVLFIPVAFIIKKINFGFYINILAIIVLCIGLYIIGLKMLKDENLELILEKVKNIVRRRKNG